VDLAVVAVPVVGAGALPVEYLLRGLDDDVLPPSRLAAPVLVRLVALPGPDVRLPQHVCVFVIAGELGAVRLGGDGGEFGHLFGRERFIGFVTGRPCHDE
jgi:hypothetical protein